MHMIMVRKKVCCLILHNYVFTNEDVKQDMKHMVSATEIQRSQLS